MTAAQIKAQANFKKAIAYRTKTGCSLKEAFAYVKGGKVTGLDKVVKKGNKTTVQYTKKAKKKAIPKKKVSQGVLFGVKKKAAKKSAVKSTHKDTKSHNVNIRVMSGLQNDIFRSINNYEKLKIELLIAQNDYKNAKDKFSKSMKKSLVDRLKYELRERKFVLTNLNKELKNKIK